MLSRLRKNRGFTLIELMIVVAIIGILAAIAIPNFIKFQAKSKQSEAKTNLKSIFTAQKAFYGEKDRFSTTFGIIGFAPEKGNRYTYAVGGTDTIVTDTARFSEPESWQGSFTGANGLSSAGVEGSCPTCSFGAIAYGNVDNDSISDSWAISSDNITNGSANCISDENAAGGVSMATYDDVACDP
jgi:type IV pilus assembly protein PilA